MTTELSIVVPTLNEVSNIEPLLERLAAALAGCRWEVVFVDDDSSDGTADLLRRLSREHDNVRCLRRIGRRGLSSAVIEGMLAVSSPYIAVMDADLQHDERLLPEMLRRVREDECDIAVASRFLEDASADGLSSRREHLSRMGARIAQWVIKARLSDPLSGFFLLRQELLEEVSHSLSGKGYKILIDILASTKRPLRVSELPLRFRVRHSGASKLDTLVMLEFAFVLIEKVFGRLIPLRFVIFVMIGLGGAFLHVGVLWLMFRQLHVDFLWAQGSATLVAMTSNFFFNNQLTHRDAKLVGVRFLSGLLTFYVICSVGAIINLQLAEWLYGEGIFWLLAGLIGATVGSVWNYGVSSTITWRRSWMR